MFWLHSKIFFLAQKCNKMIFTHKVHIIEKFQDFELTWISINILDRRGFETSVDKLSEITDSSSENWMNGRMIYSTKILNQPTVKSVLNLIFFHIEFSSLILLKKCIYWTKRRQINIYWNSKTSNWPGAVWTYQIEESIEPKVVFWMIRYTV